MMERYSGDFLSAVDGLRALLGCKGRVWPVSVEPASLVRAEYGDGTRTRGEVEVDAGQSRGQKCAGSGSSRKWRFTPTWRTAIRAFDAVIIGPGSFFTSLMPPLLVRGVKEALADVRGPVILIANLLTEGRGMAGFTAADAARWVERAIDRPIDVVIANTGRPSDERAEELRRRAQGAARTGRAGSRRRSRCSGRSGRATSRATTGAVSRSRCGRCSASGCCRPRRLG